MTDPVVRCISNAIQGIPDVKVEFDRQLHIANNAKKIIFKKYTLRKVQEDKAKKQCEIHPGNRAILDDLQAKIIKKEESKVNLQLLIPNPLTKILYSSDG